MQIRLTVVDPLGPSSPTAPGLPARCDVLVTAPAGTALATVAPALASAVPGGDGTGASGAGSGSGSGPVVLYAGERRLDAQRCTLGEPPLVDGAVLFLGAPGDPEPHPESADAPAQLHVVAGPDAGGVHLLHGGQIRIGRSADADVALDDPDVSRTHCAVTVAADGRVAVADLGSTNGTTLDGTRVGDRAVRFPAGALLRIGESALRLAPAPVAAARVETAPDGEGCVRVRVRAGRAGGGGEAGGGAGTPGAPGASGGVRPAPGGTYATGGGTGAGGGDTAAGGGAAGGGAAGGRRATGGGATGGGVAGSGVAGGGSAGGAATGGGAAGGDVTGSGVAGSGVTGSGVADEHLAAHARVADAADAVDTRGSDGTAGGPAGPGRATGYTHGTHGTMSVDGPGRRGPGRGQGPNHRAAEPLVPEQGGAPRAESHGGDAPAPAAVRADTSGAAHGGRPGTGPHDAAAFGGEAGSGRKGTPLRGTDVPPGMRRRGGLTAWARRLAGGRGEPPAAGTEPYDAPPAGLPAVPSPAPAPAPETWPDPAALLLTALGPGPRLWERGPGHPEALTVRLGTADRVAPGGAAPLPAVPVTAGLREAGALGLAGPRERLAGLARAVLAQLAALHSPDTLEIVLISADRGRPLPRRTAEWAWLGWLPHLRPGHGQDCRLLLALDHDQAAARAQELVRRLEDHLTDTRTATGPVRAAAAPDRRPAWAHPDDTGEAPAAPGPFTVVVVDGGLPSADVHEAVERLALEGPRAGIHVVCLAETPAASPASPVTRTYEAACAVAPVFRRCGAVALLSGDVATTLRLLRVAPEGAAPAGPVGHGTLATVDAVSLPWAERFARALAPLRPEGGSGERHARVSAPLPQAARLLDELGLARATPASLMARWADAADDPQSLGGRAHGVLGAGPRGPVGVDLAADGPHLLIEGPPGSGRTELLRALVASLASAERPDRLGVVLMDGRDGTSAEQGPGEGLRVCTDVPHVTTHLTANDPIRMREFAQSLSAELKRRAELLGRSHFTEWHTGREVSGRMVAQRTAGTAVSRSTGTSGAGAADLDTPPSTTIRLRPAASRRQAEPAPPLPRLVVVVDDLDALVTPPLGSPGRPAAGSVMRALEAVARDGERLGVHLVAATGPGGRTAQTEPALRATLRVTLDAPVPGPDEPAPGRGHLTGPDGRTVAFQGGRVTGRIPRTATLRPTVVPLDWHRMGDPPARRPVRELGNGPTDLALLASALERAAREVSAAEVPSLL
ncbi:FHA domain-containing protein [Streptomyces sp. NPDC090994]|uniref:FHA domain-containing protein n=1 Tax=Streptomyces sp. NPDC090994 TaxID=3365969 RepID=UPI0038028FC3